MTIPDNDQKPLAIGPMTADERVAFLRGVEWMREAACVIVRPPQGRLMVAENYDAREACADWIASIPAPTIPVTGFGVLGEG